MDLEWARMEISKGGIQKKLSVFGSKFLEMGHLGNLELVQEEYSSGVVLQSGFQPSGQVLFIPVLTPLSPPPPHNLQNQSVNPEMTVTGARCSLYKRSPQWLTLQCAPHSRLTQLRSSADSLPLCKLGLCTRMSWAKFPQESVSLSSMLASCSSGWVSFWCPVLDGTIGRRALEEPFLCLRTAHPSVV